MVTFAEQQVHSEVDPVQELVNPCQKILSAKHAASLRKTLQNYCDVLTLRDNDLGWTNLIQH